MDVIIVGHAHEGRSHALTLMMADLFDGVVIIENIEEFQAEGFVKEIPFVLTLQKFEEEIIIVSSIKKAESPKLKISKELQGSLLVERNSDAVIRGPPQKSIPPCVGIFFIRFLWNIKYARTFLAWEKS